MSKSRRQKKKSQLPPRRLRMKRAERLQSARSQLSRFRGKNPVRRYVRWFGVSHLCAVKELEMLGIETSPDYVAQLRRTEETKATRTVERKEQRRQQRVQEKARQEEELVAFLASVGGTTSGGVPLGLSSEEIEECIRNMESDQ